MTRRGFVFGLIKLAAAGFAGLWWLLKRAVPRRFVIARKMNRYPGPLKALGKIKKSDKWMG